jgi:hypothetical protein
MATHTRLSGSASRQASPSARNEEETRLHAQIPGCSGLDSHNEHTPTLRVPLQTELWFHSCGYEQPPHQRACGTTNSRWLAGDHCTSSDNNLRLGRLNSSSDDLMANAAVGRPSPTSPHEGRGQAVKAEEPEVQPQVVPTVSSAEKPSLAATTSAPMTAATCPPTPHQRATAAPKRTGRSSLPFSPRERERDRPRTRLPPSRRRRVVQPTAQGGPGRGRPAHGATNTRAAGGQPRSAPAVGGGTESSARATQTGEPDTRQLPAPRMANAPLPQSLREGARRGSSGGRPQPAPPSSPARIMKILEAEGGAEAAARLASPHHQNGGHHPG